MRPAADADASQPSMHRDCEAPCTSHCGPREYIEGTLHIAHHHGHQGPPKFGTESTS